MKYRVTILIFILMQVITSCTHFRPSWKAPSAKFAAQIANASPDFQQGWRDGCQTGMAGGSNSFNQMFYNQNTQDGWKMATSPDYKTAWGNAFWFCYRSDYVDQKSTTFSAVFKGFQ